MNESFSARISYVRPETRGLREAKSFYRLGLPLRDCEKIDAAARRTFGPLPEGRGYAGWTARERSDHLADIAAYLFHSRKSPLRPLPVPGCWHQFLLGSGRRRHEIAADPEVAAED